MPEGETAVCFPSQASPRPLTCPQLSPWSCGGGPGQCRAAAAPPQRSSSHFPKLLLAGLAATLRSVIWRKMPWATEGRVLKLTPSSLSCPIMTLPPCPCLYTPDTGLSHPQLCPSSSPHKVFAPASFYTWNVLSKIGAQMAPQHLLCQMCVSTEALAGHPLRCLQFSSLPTQHLSHLSLS